MEKKATSAGTRRRPARPVVQIPDTNFTEANVNHDTDTLVYAIGGLGEVGKNMYCIEHNDEIVIIDCGVLFPEDDLLGIDYVIPDYSYLVKNQSKIKALIITHGHEDHIGAIPFFLQQVHLKEIYAPRFAKYLIEKKLEEHRLTKSCKIIEINGDSRIDTKYFHIGFFNTVHSIPDSLGVLINTPNGRIVETGDFKFDLTPIGQQSDYQKMAYIGQVGVTLLMSDSTNSSVPGFSISERRVAQAIMEQVRRTPGRLLIQRQPSQPDSDGSGRLQPQGCGLRSFDGKRSRDRPQGRLHQDQGFGFHLRKRSEYAAAQSHLHRLHPFPG